MTRATGAHVITVDVQSLELSVVCKCGWRRDSVDLSTAADLAREHLGAEVPR